MVKRHKACLTYLLTSLKVIKGHLLTREGFKYRYRVIYPKKMKGRLTLYTNYTNHKNN